MKFTALLGLMFGILIGCWMSWANLPTDPVLSQLRIARVIGDVFFTGFSGFLIGELVARIKSVG